MVKIEIKRAAALDAELLAKLSETTFTDAFSHTCSNSDMNEFIDQQFAVPVLFSELKNMDDYYYIAYVNSIAAGYMRLKEDYTDYPAITRYKAIELKRIYVLKEYQSQKVGEALMQFANDFANKLKFEALWLGVWEHNVRAISFYKKQGFKETGYTHKFYIGKNESTDLWMIKKLNVSE